MVRPTGPRDPIAGPPTPQSPYPLRLRGPVIKGFGRGSKELGIPTANIPLSGLSIGGNEDLDSGIYYGFATLDYSSIGAHVGGDGRVPSASGGKEDPGERSSNHAVADLEAAKEEEGSGAPQAQGAKKKVVYPTVLSIGYNPYYKNTQRSIEIHILHTFGEDFYGATLSLVILGFIRPEYDYVSKDALVEDIREDIRVAQRSLDREGYKVYEGDEWLVGDKEQQSEASTAREAQRPNVGQKDGVGISQME
ncbi:riboflavin kinase [Corynespora cassiicola Philippines]|uniref:Riboflavin kinase n=1 Tax=Corynespora cassiicola Philippines TaxID=1448308 RepID=A0A2T2PEK5_CORCC|nr:riboflavin kinase [Corynespora cassiicola Philippines]